MKWCGAMSETLKKKGRKKDEDDSFYQVMINCIDKERLRGRPHED
jgi:hypothetical protein